MNLLHAQSERQCGSVTKIKADGGEIITAAKSACSSSLTFTQIVHGQIPQGATCYLSKCRRCSVYSTFVQMFSMWICSYVLVFAASRVSLRRAEVDHRALWLSVVWLLWTRGHNAPWGVSLFLPDREPLKAAESVQNIKPHTSHLLTSSLFSEEEMEEEGAEWIDVHC